MVHAKCFDPMQDWKSNGRIMGDVRKYDPSCQSTTGAIDVDSFPLKLAKLSVDQSKSGWQKYKVSLPNEIRMLHLTDPVNAPAWKGLVTDFDRKFFGATNM